MAFFAFSWVYVESIRATLKLLYLVFVVFLCHLKCDANLFELLHFYLVFAAFLCFF